MAQVLKLKRTAVQGKSPTTDTLELGELAINTYDGKLYFEKDNGVPSIQSIVVTDALISGSINIGGAITASNFIGNGSGLTNLPNASVSQVATVTASFDNQSSIAVTHNFNSKNIIVSVYGTNDTQIIPSSVVLTNNNTTTIGLSSAQSGYVVVAKGGHLVSGSLVQEVTAVATVTASFTAQSTISVTHNFNSKNLIVSVYDVNNSQIIPSSVVLTTLDTATIGLSSAQSGYVVVAKGGHLVTATGTISYNNLTDIPSGIISSSVTIPAGTISGSSQLTSSFDTRYTLSGSIVQASWDTLTSKPSGIVSGSSQVISIISSLNSATGSYATTGSNTFVGSQTYSGSIIPATDNTYDLGSSTKSFRHLYVSSGSIYINGAKVLSSTAQELQFTTDAGQSIKILEAGSDTITLQSADGNITLASSGGGDVVLDPNTGVIGLKGTTTLYAGNKIVSSDGYAIQFGNDLGITGSLTTTTGNINGINLSSFSSSIASTFLNQNSATSSYETKGRGIVSGSSQITYASISSIPSGIVSGSSQITFSGISSLPTLVSESSQITYTNINSIPFGIVSGSSQILGGSGIFSSSTQLPSGLVSGSSQITYTNISSIPTGIVSGSSQTIANLPTGVISGSSQLNNTSITNLTITNLTVVNETASVIFSSGSNRFGDFGDDTHEFTGSIKISGSLTLIGTSTATSYNGTINATNGVVSGSSQITYTSISSIPGGIVSGSSQTINYLNSAAPGVVSGSTQTIANLPTGTVSGSSQVVGILGSLNTYTSSQDTKNTSIATYTSSLETKNSTLATYTASLETKNTTLATYTSSLETKNSTLATYTASNDTTNTAQNTRLTTIESVTGSYETKGRSIVSGSSQVDVLSTTNIARLATTGSNTFTGTISINSGTTGFLTLGASNSYGSVSSGGGGATIYLNGATRGGTTTAASNTIVVATDGEVYITNGAANSNKIVVATNGNTTFSGTITESSSLRYKENVETIKYGLDKVLQMRGVTYDKKDNGVKEIGVIAEEIYEVLPELVLKNEEGEIDSVSYGRITAVLIEAIKEQQKQIEELKSLIK